jgi:hypothetical protein
LNTTNESLGDQYCEAVVDRLQRDGADLGPHRLGHGIGRDMRLARDRPKNRQSLGCNLNAALSKEFSRVGGHLDMLAQILELLKYLYQSKK